MKRVRFEHKGSVLSGILKGEEISVDASSDVIALSEVRLLAPVKPSKIVCVGLNYIDHAEELGMTVPESPIIFMKPPTAVIGPGDDILFPHKAGQVDYEAELAVVIGRVTRNVSREAAMDHIAGYTCFNDVTARDLQKKDIQWTRAKSFDTFAPIGPWVETDLDPSDLRIGAYLNGKKMQDSRTSGFIFDVPGLIEFISGIMTLLPGDVVTTGTPSGVGSMVPGDEIAVEIEGIGRLVNTVVSGK